jgi:hypothetical protein
LALFSSELSRNSREPVVLKRLLGVKEGNKSREGISSEVPFVNNIQHHHGAHKALDLAVG